MNLSLGFTSFPIFEILQDIKKINNWFYYIIMLVVVSINIHIAYAYTYHLVIYGKIAHILKGITFGVYIYINNWEFSTNTFFYLALIESRPFFKSFNEKITYIYTSISFKSFNNNEMNSFYKVFLMSTEREKKIVRWKIKSLISPLRFNIILFFFLVAIPTVMLYQFYVLSCQFSENSIKWKYQVYFTRRRIHFIYLFVE